MQVILGISAYYHDSAAALVVDGKIVAAAQEERFSRIKNDASFPMEACRFCLQKAGISIDEVDCVVYYEKPFLKFERLLEGYIRVAPLGLKSFIQSMPIWLKDKLHLKKIIRKNLASLSSSKPRFELLFSEHHLSHAASSYFVSPFSSAAILTVDGVGEWASSCIFRGKETTIELLAEQHYPDSVGLLYSSFTYFLGFKVNSGEYKVMGLAPYADPDSEEAQRFINLIKNHLITIHKNGSIQLNQRFFAYTYGLKMIRTKRWEELFGISKREPESKIEQCHCNLAFAIQKITEEILILLARYTKELTGENRLCLAGGVALNCVANSKILFSDIFDEIYIQPAAGDAGCAIGAALITHHLLNPQTGRTAVDLMNNAFLGTEYSNSEVEQIIKEHHLEYSRFDNFDDLVSESAKHLSQGKILGWFQGAMEFGPRALGNRSIIADPRPIQIQEIVNTKIKYRENFRPFAPAVMEEDAQKYFDIKGPSPYMLFVSQVKNSYTLPLHYAQLSIEEKMATQRSLLQSITHVDFSARVQTVNKTTNPKLYQLLSAFKAQTGCSVLLNTSFNLRGEPMVCSPQDAIKTFRESGLDFLVMNDFIITK